MSEAATDIAAIAPQFELAGAVESAQPLTIGHINDSYRVTCRDDTGAAREYLLQRLNTTIFTKPALVMHNIERVTEHVRRTLEQAGTRDVRRRVLRLARARTGQTWVEDSRGQVWRAYDFIARTTMQATVRTPQDAATAGAAFGEFQAQLADLPGPPLHESLPGFHDTPARYAAFERALAVDEFGRARAARRAVDMVLARRTGAGTLMELLRKGALPRRVAHNDAKLSNVLLDEMTGEALAVVDLDLVMPGTILFDYGDMLRSLTSDAAEDEPDPAKVTLRLDLFEALTRGYLRHADAFLTPVERRHLLLAGRIITLEQAVRFLTDHLAGDRYYRITRAGHNLDRASAQLALLAEMEARQAEMQAIVDDLTAQGA